MRLSSLRILLLALALVMQTIVGGLSVAQATIAVESQIVAHHCEEMSGPDDGAPADHASQRGACQHCLLCAGPPNVAIESRIELILTRRGVSTIGVSAPAAPFVAPRLTMSGEARGPPVEL